MSRYVLNDDEEALYRRSVRLITPSSVGHEYWEGSYADGVCAFSNEQRRELARLGLDAGAIARVVVEAAGDPRRIYLGFGTRRFGPIVTYFHRRLACPVIGRVGDRLKVIAPNGATKLVYSDGSLTRSKRRVAA